MILPNQQTTFLQQNASFSQWLNQVAHYQRCFEANPAQKWLLFEQDSYQFSILFFALIAANKQIILPQNGQKMQIHQCMQHADIFVGSEQYANIPQFCLAQNPDITDTTTPRIDFPSSTAITFFTSGSSGTPKAINKTFSELITEVEILESTFSAMLAHSEDNFQPIIMATVSHQHIYGLLFKLLWPIWSGRDVYLQMFEYPEHLLHQIKQHPKNPICLISSPAYYHRLIKDNVLIEVKNQLSALFSSGGPLNPEAAIELQSKLGVMPTEVFGSTETGGIAWRQKRTTTDDLWNVFYGIECRCDDENQQLSISSPYVNQRNWFQTDDRVKLVDKQRFQLLGRTDRIVKIEEKRCSLDEIQNYLNRHHWIEQAYVMTTGGKNNKRYCLAAVIELNKDGKKALKDSVKFKFDQQIKNYLKQYVETLVVPRKFRYLDSLPHNSQGKLNKQQLEALFD